MTLIDRAQQLLGQALKRARRNGWHRQARRIRKAQDDLRPPLRITWPGVAAARDQSRLGGIPGDPHAPNPGAGMCLMMVRLCYGIPPGTVDAATAWVRAAHRHPTANVHTIPRGYPVFWLGGTHGHGHVAVSAGDGFCWSTDLKRPGMFDRVPITQVHDQWGLQLVGWTEDLNGHAVEASTHV